MFYTINSNNSSTELNGNIIKVSDTMNWKDCTITCLTGSWYDGNTAKYRYTNEYLEIQISQPATWVTNATVEEGGTIMQVSGLDVAIPTVADSMCWNDSNNSFYPISLRTDGIITLGGLSYAGNWFSLRGVRFIMFY